MKRLKILFLTLTAALVPAAAQQTDTEVTVHNDRSGQDEVIELPEGMTYNADSLLHDWKAQKYLFPDTACANPDYNPPFAPEVFQERLRRIPAVMEMPYNSIVQNFIDRYSGRLRRSVSFMLGAGNFYIPIFEEALDYYGLPLELKYLPVIESALDPMARSHAGAVGLWQFMLPTAKRYGLEVNSLVDERRDPYKSSYAAAKYLRDLYRIFGDWNLVIAAYNCGPGNVDKAIRRADGVRDYWAIYPYLPKETRGYVPAFIAANYIMNYYCEHNICPMKTAHPVTTDTVIVTRNVHFSQIAELCNIDVAAIQSLNPQYRTDIVPGGVKPSTLCLPQEQLAAFIELKDSVYNYRADELFTRRSLVQVDETEPAPAGKSGRSSYSRNSGGKRASARSSSRNRRGGKSTTVRKGDTLSQIAARNGTTVSKLRRLNGIKGSSIKPGQKLKVK